MQYKVSINKKNISGSINLPSSKSISNRILIINALTNNPLPVHNLSDSDDTMVMLEAFRTGKNKIDIGHAGTAMRFLTAYLATKEGNWELTGSDRMKERPIGILVDALNELGADIRYGEKTGFPPLLINGKKLSGKAIELDGSISSQYISALLMIAPTLGGGMTLRLKNEITSGAYIELTLRLMEYFGIRSTRVGNDIIVPEQAYQPKEYTVEADWSGGSYWYQILALADHGEIFLENLRLDSLQGDAHIAGWFDQFGISSVQNEAGLDLSKPHASYPEKLILDFTQNPDIAQTMACLCIGKKIPFHFTGLKTLKIKETDRIAALQNELGKFGAYLTEPEHGELAWDGITGPGKMETPVINTYHDHRMALSFAPLALTGNTLLIEDPAVVSKSYPDFWNDLKIVGFSIEQFF
jgi:3-phosphoshikimate 1-carboxyvinyltransferase